MVRRGAIGPWRSALAGSLALHGALAVAVVGFVTRGMQARPARPPHDVAIELTTAPAQRAPAAQPAGPAPGSPLPAAPVRHSRTADRSPRVLGSASPDPEVPGAARSSLDRAATPPAIDANMTLRIEAAHPARGADLGDTSTAGIGDGGRGRGRVLGLATATAPIPVPAVPAAPERDEPAPSRARPPRLVYPSRERAGDEAQQLVARLTIDTDGYVVGVRLVRGAGRARDDRGAAAVWRFRYLPALDEAGHPIQATVEQHFLVE